MEDARVAELKAKTPGAGLLPLTIGAVTLEEVDAGALTLMSAFGDGSALSRALEAAHGMAFPAPNRSTGKEGARCVWFGPGQALLMGPGATASLAEHGAIVDQSDAWCVVTLGGAAAADVLARLVPVDLRGAAFKRGHTVRTLLGHMSASVTRVGSDRFMILVFRSMAATLVHDLDGAMAAVASRG
jgi:sarcosine oxidase subunit gamma